MGAAHQVAGRDPVAGRYFREEAKKTAHATQIVLLPALNAMIGITTMRMEAARVHPPLIIFVMLGTLTIDLEYPRVGLIRMTDSDEVLVELRKSLK